MPAELQSQIPGHDDSRSPPVSQTPIEAGSQKITRRTPLGSAVRALTLASATLTTGLVAGVFYAYAVSVNFGLAAQPHVPEAVGKRHLANIHEKIGECSSVLSERGGENVAHRAEGS
jgi:hypothetical protein